MDELTCNLKLHVQEQGVLCSQLLLLNLFAQLQEIYNHETDPVKIIKQGKKNYISLRPKVVGPFPGPCASWS
jgi:hypothetical protein